MRNCDWIHAATRQLVLPIAFCGTMMFTSCSDKDDPAQPSTPEQQPVTPEEAAMPELKEDFESIAEWVTAGVKRCHPYIRKFWNEEADPADFNLVLTNESCDKVYFIDANGKREVPQAEWDETLENGFSQIKNADYYFFTFQNKNCCLQIVSPTKWKEMAEMYKIGGRKVPTLQDNAYSLLHTFYHESFHKYVQSLRGWNNLGSPHYNRDQVYPAVYEPRIYRKLAILALFKAWQDPSQKDAQYARAKYWTQKYESQYPIEAEGIRQTDVDESTAEYFGLSVIHAAFSDYELLYELDLSAGIGSEAYQQSLAMHLLFRDGRLAEAIKGVSKDVITPINILLKDVAAPANYDEKQDAADVEKIRKAMDKQYSKENPFLAPVVELLERHLSGQAVYVGLDPQFNGNYYAAIGTYKLTDLPGYECEVKYESSNENVEINGCTLLSYNDYHFYPIATVEHLSLNDWQDISEELTEVPDLVFTRQATLSAVTDEPTFTLKNLPATVMYGKDKLGNEYYMCK